MFGFAPDVQRDPNNDGSLFGKMPPATLPTNALIDASLRYIFVSYCSIGDVTNVEHLGSARFSKLVRDAGLLGPLLTSTDVDIVFVRASQSVAGRQRTSRVGGGAPSTKKTLTYGLFLTALSDLANKRATARSSNSSEHALVLLLLEHMLPLAARGPPGGSSAHGAAPTDRADGGAIGEEELLARAAVLEAIFAHYSSSVRLAPAEAETEAAPFWQTLGRERASLVAQGVRAAPDDEPALAAPMRPNEPQARGSAAVMDLAAWQRFGAHFDICPTLLSKAELMRLFQAEAARAPPQALLTFPQFAHALGATAAAAFPPPLGVKSFDDGGAKSVRDLLVTMKVDQAKALAERLALTGRKVCG